MSASPDYINHLTDGAKAVELETWAEKVAGPRGKPGAGFPDDRIIPFCASLNVLPGVCTLQSCAGHPRTPEQEWSAPGQLHLWFEEQLFWRFIRCAPLLAVDPQMEFIDILFGRWIDRRAVIDIRFKGDDVGPKALQQSFEVIFEFILNLYPATERRSS